jgi:Tol biopolymer transport system component
VNTSSADGSPCLSYDGLTLYFYSDRPGGLGARDLWLAQRADLQGVFGNVRLLANVNSSYWDHEEWLSRDELTLLFVSTRPGVGRSDIWMATRTQRTDDFSAPTTLAGIDTVAREDRPAISSDGLTIIFASDRTGTMGDLDLWIATRSTLQSDFSTPTNLKTLNSAVWDADPTFSADDRELFFASPRSGSAELYRSVRTCQ